MAFAQRKLLTRGTFSFGPSRREISQWILKNANGLVEVPIEAASCVSNPVLEDFTSRMFLQKTVLQPVYSICFCNGLSWVPFRRRVRGCGGGGCFLGAVWFAVWEVQLILAPTAFQRAIVEIAEFFGWMSRTECRNLAEKEGLLIEEFKMEKNNKKRPRLALGL